MKQIYFFLSSLLFLTPLFAEQNNAVYNSLRNRYSSVQYHNDYNGWYLFSFQSNSQTFYGMSDHNGNIVVTDAMEYKLHSNYIEFHLINENQRQLHRQWQADMQVYEKKYAQYKKVEAEYEAKLSDYNIRYQNAEQVATALWKQEQDRVRREVTRQNELKRQQQQQQQSNSGWAGIVAGVLSGIAGIVDVTAAVNNVKYEPFLNKVLAEQNLLSKPAAPYNPMPTKPSEPSNGFYWKNFTLLQPCPYDVVDFDALKAEAVYIDVQKNGKYGLVNGKFRELVPCQSTYKVKQKYIPSSGWLVKVQSKYGILNNQEKYVMPCEYDEILQSNGYLLCKKQGLWGVYDYTGKAFFHCHYQSLRLELIDEKLMLMTQNNGLWGLIDFSSGEQLLPNSYEKIELIKNLQSYFLVKRKGKYGLYSYKGILIIPPQYDNVKLISINNDDYIQLTKGNTSGLTDADGNTIIPADKYQSFEYKDDVFYVKQASGMGVLDAMGNEIVPCKYQQINVSSARKDLFVARRDNLMGLVDWQGEELFDFRPYKQMQTTAQYIVVQGENYKYGAIDYSGAPIINPHLKYSYKVSETVQKNKKKQAAMAVNNTSKFDQIKQAVQLSDNQRSASVNARNTFGYFAQNYVEREVNEWQKKGEFEKTEDWRKRVNNETRQQKIYLLTKQAQDDYIRRALRHMPKETLQIVGDYDSDNETYRIHCNNLNKDILVPVPIQEAQDFKTYFNEAKKTPHYFVENDSISIAEYAFRLPNGKTYKYSNQASLQYNIAQVDYNFDVISYDKTALEHNPHGKQVISSSSVVSANSDVDYQIPVADTQEDRVFVIIWANQNYTNAPQVEYAFNDGRIFSEYCQKTLGIPEQNITFRSDATYAQMRVDMGSLKEIANSDLYKDNCKFIIYYSGHGMPNETGTATYLLPVDGEVTDVGITGIKVSDLYETLSELQSESVIFLDACFSGMTKSGSALATTKSFYKVAQGKPRGNCVVFSASSGSEVAHQYEKKKHSLFTYFLLKKLQETKGNVTYGTLFDFLNTNVQKTALQEVKKRQTPSINVGPNVTDWKNRKLGIVSL